jgi:hypothetical protein
MVMRTLALLSIAAAFSVAHAQKANVGDHEWPLPKGNDLAA